VPRSQSPSSAELEPCRPARSVRWRQQDHTILRLGPASPPSVQEKGTKTNQRRRIALDAETLQLLEEHRQRRVDDCAKLDLPFDRTSFVFSLFPDGSEPIKPPTISQRYRRTATRLGLRSTRLHSLRHYTATELIAAGVDVRTVAGRLGHASGGATTLRVYAAWVGEADRRAAATMAGLMPSRGNAVRPPRSPYEKIAAALREEITSGRRAAGETLPTVTELANMHGISVGTAQRAVALLRDEGLVSVARGKRAVVAANSGSV